MVAWKDLYIQQHALKLISPRCNALQQGYFTCRCIPCCPCGSCESHCDSHRHVNEATQRFGWFCKGHHLYPSLPGLQLNRTSRMRPLTRLLQKKFATKNTNDRDQAAQACQSLGTQHVCFGLRCTGKQVWLLPALERIYLRLQAPQSVSSRAVEAISTVFRRCTWCRCNGQNLSLLVFSVTQLCF